MALRNFKLIIEYDGTRYSGWQRQPKDRTIQEEIETALATMTRRRITLIGSGRTDAGVHALGQTANFSCDTAIDAAAFHKGLNSLLPDDIVIRACEEVPAQFHARYDVKSKTYRYRIRTGQLPTAIGRQYEWWIRAPLDLDAMRQAAAQLVGQKDFKAFEGTGSPRSHTIRDVMRAEIRTESQGSIVFEIEAEGFLRYMVRNIVGTLVLVGKGVMQPGQIRTILESRDRGQAGATAPAQGLFLVHVNYG